MQTKRFKKGTVRKCVFKGNRGKKQRDNKFTNKCNFGSQLTRYEFFIIVILNDKGLFLTIDNFNYNHKAIFFDFYLTFHKKAIIEKVKNNIVILSKILAAPAII